MVVAVAVVVRGEAAVREVEVVVRPGRQVLLVLPPQSIDWAVTNTTVPGRMLPLRQRLLLHRHKPPTNDNMSNTGQMIGFWYC